MYTVHGQRRVCYSTCIREALGRVSVGAQSITRFFFSFLLPRFYAPPPPPIVFVARRGFLTFPVFLSLSPHPLIVDHELFSFFCPFLMSYGEKYQSRTLGPPRPCCCVVGAFTVQ